MKKLITILFLLVLSSQSLLGQFTTLWERKTPATDPTWMTTSGNETRSLAYGYLAESNGGVKNHRLVVARASSNYLYILNAETGADIGTLNETGISGGNVAINDVEISEDGIIFACNRRDDNTINSWKVYRWDHEAASPTAVINYVSGVADRLGDRFTIVGRADNNTLTIYVASSNSARVYRFTTSDYGNTFSPSVITLSGTDYVAPSNVIAAITPISAGVEADFYYKQVGRQALKFNKDGIQQGGAIPSFNRINQNNAQSIKYLNKIFNNQHYILVGEIESTTLNNLRITGVNVTDPTASSTYGATASLGTNTNGNKTGDVAFKQNSDGSFTLFVLATNNGLGAYTTNTYPLTPVYFPGTNGWVHDNTTKAYLKEGLGGGTYYYGFTSQIVQNNEFKITKGASYDYQWSGGYWIPGSNSANYVWTIPQNGGNIVVNGDNVGDLKAYTHFTVKEPVNSSSATVGVMTLEAIPQTISSVTDNFTSAGNDVTVTVTLSGAKAASEKVFVRYTTDNWTTSKVVEASTGSNPYTATVPGVDVNGTTNNSYYVLTTTFSLIDNQSSEYYDIRTINYSTNTGKNFPLPVELQSLSARLHGPNIILNWATATEVNSHEFVVERNSNNVWSAIGNVNASGNSNSPKQYSFTDNNLQQGKYQYRLKMIDNDGSYEYSQTVEVNIDVPKEFALMQNYPNPFNPVTNINYTIPVDSKVMLVIYSISGEKVAELINETQSAGSYSIPFNAANLASGTYVYRLIANDFVQTKKMLLIK